MKVVEIAKLLADRINQEHYILSLMKRLAYAIQKHEAKKRKEVEADNRRLRKALKFYAKYPEGDLGVMASQALAPAVAGNKQEKQ